MTASSPPDFTRLAPASGSTILIIGGFGGIGFAVTQQALALGLKPIVMDLSASIQRHDAAASLDTIPIDLCDENSIIDAFAALGEKGAQLDSLVICSGYTKGNDRIASLDTSRFDDVLSGNLRGPTIALRECIPYLAPSAAVVFLSTAIGQIGAPGYAAYGAAKAGLNSIVRILAAELAPGIRVNGVAPGAVDTAFIRGGYGAGAPEAGDAERFDIDAYNAKVPMGRMGVSEDIVGPILFLLSDNSRYITGQVLHVNGGAFMRD